LGLRSRLGLRESRCRHGEYDRGYKQTFHSCSLLLLLNNPPDPKTVPLAIQLQRPCCAPHIRKELFPRDSAASQTPARRFEIFVTKIESG
jgi:hypothetical protein